MFPSLYIVEDDIEHPQQDTSVEVDKGYPQQDTSVAADEVDHQEIYEGIVYFFCTYQSYGTQLCMLKDIHLLGLL